MPGLYTGRFRRRLAAERARFESEVRASLRLDPEYHELWRTLGPRAAEERLEGVMAGYYRRSAIGRLVGSPLFAALLAAGKTEILLRGFLGGRRPTA